PNEPNISPRPFLIAHSLRPQKPSSKRAPQSPTRTRGTAFAAPTAIPLSTYETHSGCIRSYFLARLPLSDGCAARSRPTSPNTSGQLPKRTKFRNGDCFDVLAPPRILSVP